jgi:iron(III) transport system ATP-binding protein
MLKVQSLYTEYVDEHGDTVKAAQDVSFEVPAGKLFHLARPSGCGKTTTLRSIAGWKGPNRERGFGRRDRFVYSSTKGIFVAPNKRNFGMVFQSYAIWPHMNVFQNAAFPSGRRQTFEQDGSAGKSHAGADRGGARPHGGSRGDQAFRRAAAAPGAGARLGHGAAALAAGRALSNLDAKLRERMRFELKRLQRDLKLTTVYVTHDQNEALALSHEIAVMNDGHIIQIGSPRDIYERPRNRFVADFVGSANFVEATVIGRENEAGFFRVQTALGPLNATRSNRSALRTRSSSRCGRRMSTCQRRVLKWKTCGKRRSTASSSSATISNSGSRSVTAVLLSRMHRRSLHPSARASISG